MKFMKTGLTLGLVSVVLSAPLALGASAYAGPLESAGSDLRSGPALQAFVVTTDPQTRQTTFAATVYGHAGYWLSDSNDRRLVISISDSGPNDTTTFTDTFSLWEMYTPGTTVVFKACPWIENEGCIRWQYRSVVIPEAPSSENVPVQVASIADGETYRPGQNVLAGTGTKGASVSVKNVGSTGTGSEAMGSAIVGDDGRWSLPERTWGPSSDYWMRVTQTNPDKTTSVANIHILAPRFTAITLLSPKAGETYVPLQTFRFEGKATPFASVTVRSANTPAIYYTGEADKQGNWSFSRAWGPSSTYNLIIEQVSAQGSGDLTGGLVWAPTP